MKYYCFSKFVLESLGNFTMHRKSLQDNIEPFSKLQFMEGSFRCMHFYSLFGLFFFSSNLKLNRIYVSKMQIHQINVLTSPIFAPPDTFIYSTLTNIKTQRWCIRAKRKKLPTPKFVE